MYYSIHKEFNKVPVVVPNIRDFRMQLNCSLALFRLIPSISTVQELLGHTDLNT
jgi:hypothetical protein